MACNGIQYRLAYVKPIRYTHSRFKVDCERYSRTNNSSKVEDRPENTDKSSFLTFSRIRKNERTLSDPEKTRTNAKDGTGSDNETSSVGMNVHGTVIFFVQLFKYFFKKILTGMKQYKDRNPSFQGVESDENQERC